VGIGKVPLRKSEEGFGSASLPRGLPTPSTAV